MHPFRFAVQASKAADAKAWRCLARKAEGLGYSTLYVPDHLDDQLAPVAALSVAAEATTVLRVGSLVFDNDYRHPVVLAKEVATLDLFSEGRVECGLGAGWMMSDYNQAGIDYDSPSVRIARLKEAVHIMKSLWSTPTVTFEGTYYKLNNAQGLPRPYTKPHPPIIIGGGGPRVLRLAARQADIVGINPALSAGHIGPELALEILPERYRQKVSWVEKAAGERFYDLELQCLTFFVKVGPDGKGFLEQLANGFGIPVELATKSPIALGGSVEEIVDTLKSHACDYGLTYWVIHDDSIDAFAPVVAELAGSIAS
ncbi:MAG: TIGR03621 family F420-dependent LLM class oxidoreductase [Actinobacteria bacterium]|nr:TIGR03621 family F420-dependent LLM class oxidoreductase [Actinomycetota bacterium]MCL6104119.1 TIGR03621 family F420-dependent LLM class oxidoreductase [Actinomycetota bacterium]